LVPPETSGSLGGQGWITPKDLSFKAVRRSVTQPFVAERRFLLRGFGWFFRNHFFGHCGLLFRACEKQGSARSAGSYFKLAKNKLVLFYYGLKTT